MSYPEHWQCQKFKSRDSEFLLLGKGSRRHRLYECKKNLQKNVEKILDLDKSENYVILVHDSDEILEENEIFLEELQDVVQYLTTACTRVLDFVDKIKTHGEELLRKKQPVVEEQEVFEVEIPDEHITTIKQEKEDTEIDVKQEKKEKPKHHPKIVKVEPRPTPVSDSDQDDPYVKKFPKERKQRPKKPGNYQCKQCDDNFHTLQDYGDHLGKHEQMRYECNICGKSSDSKRSLSAHIKCHTDKFPCQTCGKILMSKSSLHNHKRIIHDRKTHVKNVRNH